jgi:hypothetical protein
VSLAATPESMLDAPGIFDILEQDGFRELEIYPSNARRLSKYLIDVICRKDRDLLVVYSWTS